MRIAKRCVDIVAGSVLTLVALPVIVGSAATSALALRSWPFFVQLRVGRGGRPFRIVKIRTLPADVPSYATKTSLDHASLSRPMAFLRRTHLDELPQLFLVPVGRMSLVGPRPEMSFLHERLPQCVAELRTSVRPGCTGLWQISEGSVGLIHEMPEYDRFYLLQPSIRFDLWILWRTFRVMFTKAPLIGIDDIPRWALRPTSVDIQPDLTAPQPVPSPARESV